MLILFIKEICYAAIEKGTLPERVSLIVDEFFKYYLYQPPISIP